MTRLATAARVVAVVAAVLAVWYVGAFLLEQSGDRIAYAKLPYPHLIVDKVLRIEDNRDGVIIPPRPVVMAARTVEAMTPVEPGLIEIQARVTLTVSIK